MQAVTELPKFRALSTLASEYCKVPPAIALSYANMKVLTSENFKEHAKCMIDQNTLSDKASLRFALYIDQWKPDQLETRLNLVKFQTKIQGTAATCDAGCQG